MRKPALRFTVCILIVVTCAGGLLVYRWYSNRPHVRWSYWAPAIKQTGDTSVVGEGLTMLATPEKDPHDSFPGDIIGRPLRVTITPAAFQGKYVSLRFSALTDQEVVFRPPFYGQLIHVLDEYDALKERVIQQKRLSYEQVLASIPFLDTDGKVHYIRVLLRSAPQKSVVSHGLPSDEGQTIYLRLDLPFPLEQTGNFDHTEVSIPDDGV